MVMLGEKGYLAPQATAAGRGSQVSISSVSSEVFFFLMHIFQSYWIGMARGGSPLKGAN